MSTKHETKHKKPIKAHAPKEVAAVILDAQDHGEEAERKIADAARVLYQQGFEAGVAVTAEAAKVEAAEVERLREKAVPAAKGFWSSLFD